MKTGGAHLIEKVMALIKPLETQINSIKSSAVLNKHVIVDDWDQVKESCLYLVNLVDHPCETAPALAQSDHKWGMLITLGETSYILQLYIPWTYSSPIFRRYFALDSPAGWRKWQQSEPWTNCE